MKIKIFDFYAVWCGPCKAYSRILDKVKEEYPEVEIERINVDYDEDTDEGKRVKNLTEDVFGVRNIPYTVIVTNDDLDNPAFARAGVLELGLLRTELNKLIK